jgi:hypothetical protein
MVTRLTKPVQRQARITPILPHEWLTLLKTAIAQAEQRGDPRLEGFRKGLEVGQAERVLRRLGIVCQADLRREFPELKT